MEHSKDTSRWDRQEYPGDNPIIGVEGKAFDRFDIDVDVGRIDEEMCRLMATIDLSFIPNVYGGKPPDVEGDEGRPPHDNPLLPNQVGMNAVQSRKYRVFKRKVDVPWAFGIALKPNKFATRDQDITPWADFADKVPYTKHVISTKFPFSEIGRVMVYGSWAGTTVPCHMDDAEGYKFFINFNPSHYRPAYIWDPIAKKKIYKPKDHIFYTFNQADYHGVDAVPYFSYTIRIDGKHLDDW